MGLTHYSGPKLYKASGHPRHPFIRVRLLASPPRPIIRWLDTLIHGTRQQKARAQAKRMETGKSEKNNKKQRLHVLMVQSSFSSSFAFCVCFPLCHACTFCARCWKRRGILQYTAGEKQIGRRQLHSPLKEASCASSPFSPFRSYSIITPVPAALSFPVPLSQSQLWLLCPPYPYSAPYRLRFFGFSFCAPYYTLNL